uniref:Uncharacterized protein n=1 Tax=Romanomermis culicivorax TaxID=13658 RepID=A0A915HKT6_ROMCU
MRWENQKEKIDLKDQQINPFERKVDLLIKVLENAQDWEKENEKEQQKKIKPDEQKEKLLPKWELIFQKEESKSLAEDEIINQNHKVLVNQLRKLRVDE